jgi:hypothetical protein
MIGMCQRLAWTFVGLLLAAATAAAQSPLTVHGVNLPGQIAGAQRAELRNYQNPALGSSVEYRLLGWKIDVYIYDLGQKSIPNDALSAPVTGQLKQATDDIFNSKDYSQVETKLKYAIRDNAARVRFLCSRFGYVTAQSRKDSYLCVTSAQNKFVKFRLTADQHAGSEAKANAFVQAWIDVLWPGS